MGIYQAWNPRTQAWVKYCFEGGGFKPVDVKQIKPHVPFQGIPKRGKRR